MTGSVKFDGLESDRSNPKTWRFRKALGLSPTELVFVAGSTMEGEEEAALAAYRAARVELSATPPGAGPPPRRAVRPGRLVAEAPGASG